MPSRKRICRRRCCGVGGWSSLTDIADGRATSKYGIVTVSRKRLHKNEAQRVGKELRTQGAWWDHTSTGRWLTRLLKAVPPRRIIVGGGLFGLKGVTTAAGLGFGGKWKTMEERVMVWAVSTRKIRRGSRVEAYRILPHVLYLFPGILVIMSTLVCKIADHVPVGVFNYSRPVMPSKTGFSPNCGVRHRRHPRSWELV